MKKQEQSFWSDVLQKVSVARRQIAEGKVVDGEEAMDAIMTELEDEPVRGEQSKAGDEVSP